MGRLPDSIYIGDNSQLRGSGAVEGDVYFGDRRAYLDPGNNRGSATASWFDSDRFGSYTIDGDLNMPGGSTLFLAVGNDGSDLLSVTGDVFLNAEVKIEFTTDFAWQDGRFFDLVCFGGTLDWTDAIFSYEGTLAQTEGLIWHESDSCLTLLREQDLATYLGRDVPEPSTLIIAGLLAACGLFTRRRRR